jgi:hypothetical protein
LVVHNTAATHHCSPSPLITSAPSLLKNSSDFAADLAVCTAATALRADLL